MRTGVAVAMALMLLSIVAVCPLMACAVTVGSHAGGESCCHKSQQRPTPCPRNTVPDCPYLVLENGKTPEAVAPVATFVVHPTSADIAVPSSVSVQPVDRGLPESTGLFLRIRVLRV